MNERRQLWSAHNSLRSHHPLMLVFPEGAWLEMIPGKTFACHSELARLIEMRLRQTIYTYEHFHDDTIVEAEWISSEWWNSDFISDIPGSSEFCSRYFICTLRNFSQIVSNTR